MRVAFSYLAVSFGCRPLGPSDFLFHGEIVDEGVPLWWSVVWLWLLSKVELNSTILHQDMREQGPTCQCLLCGLESNTQPDSIFGEAHLNLVTAVKVLKLRHKQRKENIFGFTCRMGFDLPSFFSCVDFTYDVTADDIIFTKLLTKVCELAVRGLFPCSSISIRKGLLT